MANPQPTPLVQYNERLTPSIGVYAVLAGLTFMVFLACIPLGGWVPHAAALGTLGTGLAWLFFTTPELVITDHDVSIRGANTPRSLIRTVEPFDHDQARQARGPNAPKGAFFAIRGWVRPVVVIHLADQQSGPNAWVVSTRKPEQVAAILNGDHL